MSDFLKAQHQLQNASAAGSAHPKDSPTRPSQIKVSTAASAGGKSLLQREARAPGYETSALPSPWQLTLVCQPLRNGQIIQEQKWIQKLLSYF